MAEPHTGHRLYSREDIIAIEAAARADGIAIGRREARHEALRALDVVGWEYAIAVGSVSRQVRVCRLCGSEDGSGWHDEDCLFRLLADPEPTP